MSRLRQLIRKEFLQIRRDPVVVRMIIIAPIFQLLVFGYAATNDVRHVPVAVYDADRSADSRRLIEKIGQMVYFDLTPLADDPRELAQAILHGRAQIGVYIPHDLARTVARGQTAQIGLYVDGSDSNTAGVAAAYLMGLLRAEGLQWQERQARREGGYGSSLPSVVSRPRVWYNEDLRSVNYMVPGVFGLILLVLTVNLAGLSIVRERETGTLEQLMVTPLQPLELLLGKMIPFAALGLLDSGLVFLVARGWFQVPFRGSLVLLFAMALIFLLNTLGLGLLISAISRTQQQAQLTAFLFIMPSVLLSGFMFPIANMPHAVQLLTYAIPFRYFLEIARGVFLRGVGVHVLWPQILTLTLLGLGTFLGGVAAFRKHL